MKIDFSGTISPELEQNIRAVYFSEAVSLRFMLYMIFVAVTAFIVSYWLHVDIVDTIRFREIRPVNGTYPLHILLLLGLPILIAFYLAFLRLPHWWKWWWNRVKNIDFTG